MIVLLNAYSSNSDSNYDGSGAIVSNLTLESLTITMKQRVIASYQVIEFY